MRRRAVLLMVVFFSVPMISWADDYYWIDPSGGELGDSTKWNPASTPGEDDYVYFTEPNSYTVWLDDNYNFGRMTVEGSDLTLDLNGYEYTLDTTDDYNCSVVIGNYATGSVTVRNGGVYSHDLFIARNGGDSGGRLDLSGAGTFWMGHEIDGPWFGFFYGAAGDADVSVTDGAQLIHGHGQCGIGTEGTAVFDIDGQDSEWFVGGFFEMSAYGTTTTNVSNGGRARMGYLTMATYRGSEATINLTGVDQTTELAIENGWWDDVSLFIGGSGKGIINLTDSFMYNQGNTVIGQKGGGKGELNIDAGSSADCQGSVAVGGSLEAAGGEGLINVAGTLNCARAGGQSMIVWPDGVVRLDIGWIIMDYEIVLASPIDLQGGTLEGWGTIFAQVNNYGGVVAPGAGGDGYDDWKVLNIGYDYTQDADATLKIPIAGISSGGWSYWNYGGLNVSGAAALDGYLDVDLWDGFEPAYTDEYVIVEAASVSGKFINAASEYVFEDGTFEVVYEPDRVILTHYESEPRCAKYPMGDLNQDCRVNLLDLAVMAGSWLTCGLEPGEACGF